MPDVARLTDQVVDAFWVDEEAGVFCLRSEDAKGKDCERFYRVTPLLAKGGEVVGWELKDSPKPNPTPADRYGDDGRTPKVYHVELTRWGPRCDCPAAEFLTHRLGRPCKHVVAGVVLALWGPPARNAAAGA